MPTAPPVVNVALVQSKASPDPTVNVKRTLDAIERSADLGAHVVCTQELFRSLYFCQREDASLFELAESIPGPTTEVLQEVARRRGIVVVGSLFEKRAPGLFHNTAVVIDADGSLAGTYRKTHVPDDPNYYEKFYFTPGDQGYRAFDTRAGRIGVLVCWDQWFPEAARLTAMQGAKILFYPTAIGAHARESAGVPEAQRDAWTTIQRAHAIANGVFVAAANRTGVEDDMRFWGSSFVAGPFGQVIARAGADADEIVLARCDAAEVDRTREAWPFLRDRRIDAYDGLLRRWGS